MAATVTNASILEMIVFFNGLGATALGLFENNYTPDDDTLLSDLVEPSWDGYTGIILDLHLGPVLLAPGRVGYLLPGQTFGPSTDGLPHIVYGYWIDDGSGNLKAAERFTLPVTFDPLHPTLVLDLEIDLEQG